MVPGMARPEHQGTWGPILRRRCAAALALLDDAIRDCPDDDWATSVWPVRDDDAYVWPVRHMSDAEPGDEATQRELLEWFSAFWNVAYHALFFLDVDLSAREIDSYAPPAPFAEADHEAHVVPNRPYTRDALLGYVAHVGRKVQAVTKVLSDDDATTVVPAHRYGSRAFAEIVLATVAHTHEHGAQLHLFLGQNRT